MPNRVALVTGAARGIGLAVARRLGAAGYGLCLFDRAAASLDGAVDELRQHGLVAEGVAGDAARAADVAKAFDRAAALGSVIGVAHCAGVSPTLAPAADIFRINFGGTRLLLDHASRSLAEGAAIVVIASIAGHMSRAAYREAIGDPTAPEALGRLESLTDVADLAYGISKLAVLELVKRRAFELGRRGIRLNSVSPNITNTPMGKSEIAGHEIIMEMVAATPIARLAEPEEVAAAVAFLLSPDAAYVTGADLLVDGGFLATLGQNV